MRLIFSFLDMSLSQQDLGRWQGIAAVAVQDRYPPLSRQAGSCLQKEKKMFKMGEFPSI